VKHFGKVLILSGTILAGSTTMPFVNQGEAAAVYMSKEVYQTTDNLNLRSGAGTKYNVIFTIPKGKQITASDRYGDWFKVTYSYSNKGKVLSRTGWVAGTYLKKVNTNSAQAVIKLDAVVSQTKTPIKSFQTTANLNIRSGPSVKYSVVKTIPKGSIITSSEQKGTWSKVSYSYTSNKKKISLNGWVSASYLKEYYQYSNVQGTFYFTKKNSSLYQTPDKKMKAVFNITADNGFYSTQKIVNSIGETWYKVVYNGKTLYVISSDVTSYIAKSFSKLDFITKNETYLFSSYGSSYMKLVKIPKNTRLTSTSSIGNWYKVSFGGKTGYVSYGNLAKYSPPVVKPAPIQTAPAPIPPAQTPVVQAPTNVTLIPVPVQSTPATEQPVPTPVQPVLSNPGPSPQPVLTETPISGKTFVTITNLNLRKTAGTESEILTVIPNATFVFPSHKVSNGWYKVVYNGKTGYLSGDYIKEVITGDPMHRDGYQFIDLRKPSKVTASQIDNYINSNLSGRTSVLAGKGQAFMNVGNKYGINALYLAAHAIHESGFGTSNISLGKNNLFGFGAYDATPFVGAVRFASIEQNMDYIAQEMKATYLNPINWKYKGFHLGFSTRTVSDNTRMDVKSEGMNYFYASDVKWGQKIAAHMQKILPYNKADYNQAANTSAFPLPARPAGFDSFPLETQALAKQDIRLTSQKGSTLISLTIKKDTMFTISEKHNDYWVKIKVDNKEYWTNDIKFDRYKEFVSVRNLGRVTATSLNVRPAPSIVQAPISALKLNDYVHFALNQDGNLIMDNSKSWYSVKLADGRSGWVSAQYIVPELK
jgi:mannosyl-glycoprotein endo-beta-N-acetylglucosaminidase